MVWYTDYSIHYIIKKTPIPAAQRYASLGKIQPGNEFSAQRDLSHYFNVWLVETTDFKQ